MKQKLFIQNEGYLKEISVFPMTYLIILFKGEKE